MRPGWWLSTLFLRFSALCTRIPSTCERPPSLTCLCYLGRYLLSTKRNKVLFLTVAVRVTCSSSLGGLGCNDVNLCAKRVSRACVLAFWGHTSQVRFEGPIYGKEKQWIQSRRNTGCASPVVTSVRFHFLKPFFHVDAGVDEFFISTRWNYVTSIHATNHLNHFDWPPVYFTSKED